MEPSIGHLDMRFLIDKTRQRRPRLLRRERGGEGGGSMLGFKTLKSQRTHPVIVLS